MAEQSFCKAKVGGSNPLSGSMVSDSIQRLSTETLYKKQQITMFHAWNVVWIDIDIYC